MRKCASALRDRRTLGVELAKTPISLPRPMKAARGFCHAKQRPLREDADTIIARVRRQPPRGFTRARHERSLREKKGRPRPQFGSVLLLRAAGTHQPRRVPIRNPQLGGMRAPSRRFLHRSAAMSGGGFDLVGSDGLAGQPDLAWAGKLGR